MCLACRDHQRVKLIEERREVCRWILCERISGESGESRVAPAIVPRRGLDEPMAFGDAAKILVGNGNGFAQRVEKDCVRCLRTDAGKREQTGAKRVG